MKVHQMVTLGVVLLAAVFVGYAVWQGPKEGPPEIKNLRSWQETDAPGGYEIELPNGERVIPPYDPRLDLFSGIDRFRVPLARRFDFPMGAANGALTYNAQSFWEMNERRGGRHTGDDLNGIGGMNTDLGDPVYAIGNGLVVYAGEPSPGWGKTLVIAHRLSDGRLVQSMYAHLESIGVSYGKTVVRGQRIASVGGANGLYPAHLHFEIHEGAGLSLGAGYVSYRSNRLDPTKFIEEHRGAEPDDLGRSVGEIVKEIGLQEVGF